MASARAALARLSSAFGVVETWWTDRGLPLELLYVPGHLSAVHGVHADPCYEPLL